MENKQTAVEWLVEQLTAIRHLEMPKGSNIVTTIISEAKQMEKDQMFDYIKENYVNGENSLKFHQEEFEKYFNNNFNVQ